MKSFDVIIVGGGAAGLMCAIEAGKRGRSVVVIDHAKKMADKIRISGGGRCNFTNIHASPENYLSQNPHFCVSALKRYGAYDFIGMVQEHGIAYHEKTLGQLFCDESSQLIIDMLLNECVEAGVKLWCEAAVEAIEKQEGQGFVLALKDNQKLACSSLVIATGGPSIPKMGASSWGHGVAKQFGLNVVPLRAALVPFTLTQKMLTTTKELSGVSAHVRVSCNGTQFEEGMLFTHRGLSGPAILQISSYWNEGDEVTVDFMPHTDVLEWLKKLRTNSPKQEISTILQQNLSKRLVQFLCELVKVSGPVGGCSNAMLEKLAGVVNSWRVKPNGTEGYRTAEVTLGGVDTNALSSKTMETRDVPGLYFIGEVVDVTGHLGGYNFQWAWASGHAAGQYV